jgi:hypothetical protein
MPGPFYLIGSDTPSEYSESCTIDNVYMENDYDLGISTLTSPVINIKAPNKNSSVVITSDTGTSGNVITISKGTSTPTRVLTISNTGDITSVANVYGAMITGTKGGIFTGDVVVNKASDGTKGKITAAGGAKITGNVEIIDNEGVGDGNLSMRGGSIEMRSGNITTALGNIFVNGGYIEIGLGSITLNSNGSGVFEGSVTAPAFYQESDERLKTFTEDYDINLDDIKNIKTGRFYWNSDENQVINGGVTAQSVEKYFPELVREDENGTKTVNYDGLAGVAIAAIKKLTERIEELENIVYNK